MKTKPKVVVVGGGFGGLEAAFSLRHQLAGRIDLTLVSDHDYFVAKPDTIFVPFGEPPERCTTRLGPAMRRKKIDFVADSAHGVDVARKTVLLNGGEVRYDFLVLATGAAMRPQEIPGLREHAVTVWTLEDMLRLRTALTTVLEKTRSGQRQRVLFLVPPNNRCATPLYELVLMTDTWLREQTVRSNAELSLTTYENGFIEAYGPRLNTAVAENFRERGINGHTGFVVSAIEPGVALYQDGRTMPFDLLVSFPPHVAAQEFEGLPCDDRGFLHVEPDSRRLRQSADVYAVGDTADFPIKQGFLALLQADAAASHIAADIAGKPADINFQPMSMCVIEELDKATFAQVPLKYTGDAANPIAVDTQDAKHYKVGVSPVWRAGKDLISLYLPWRFGRGEPFHVGLGWKAINLGLKVTSRLLART